MNRNVTTAILLIAIIVGLGLAAIEIHKTALIIVNGGITPVVFWGFTVRDALEASGIKVSEGDMIDPHLDEPIHEGGAVNITTASWIVIDTDDQTQIIWTAERIPEQILNQQAIYLNPGDELRSGGDQISQQDPLPYKPTHTLQVIRSSKITLTADGEDIVITSTAPTLGSALWEAGIQLNSADRLSPPMETLLNGQEITVELERSREITIQFLDQKKKTRVLSNMVGEALAAAGLPLQGLDYSIPSENEPIPDDGRVRVVHVHEEIILEQENLPFGLEYQPLADLPLDSQQFVQVGEYGLLAKRIRIVYEDDQEISREIENEWVAKQPKPRIIGYGTRLDVQTVNTPSGPVQYWRAVEAYATSYSPCRIGVAGQCSNRTASGAELEKGVVGVIRSWYNAMKGSAVYIPGYGFATIQDIGAGFSDRHWVDLGYSDGDWISWSSYVTVYFLTPAPANILYILE